MRRRAARSAAPLLLLALVAGCGGPLSDAELVARGVFILPERKPVPAFSLIDHTGASFDNDSLTGKWTFVFFGFTYCPDICPTSLAEMGQAEAALIEAGAERADAPFQGVLVSVDLERDGLEQLAAYMGAFSPRFLGLRGPLTNIGRLAEALSVKFGKVPDGDGGFTIEHSGSIAVLDPGGSVAALIKLPHTAETIRLTYQALAARL